MMAVVSATSNGLAENTTETKENRKGWLSKRTHFTYRWKPAWFEVTETKLMYGDSKEVPQKTINLIGAEVAATEGDRAYGWTITPKHSRRTYFLRARSEAEQQGWMLAICEAQLSSRDHASNACVVQ
ncbi:hypothetical protein AGOR_G00082730 [Albula goreensis]|uniref:PH domain-containing protein n=1 Tax=Albula goreensis TaxID=1534307 RepID=A0A8T3DLJ8_9TELE|nr:hypothetical protein AGOR_G00082730 [Albula goreensis]